jgi:magnesium transporter
VYWIDVHAPRVDDLKQFLDQLELHPAITAACTDASDPPRVITLERFLFAAFPFCHANNETSCLRVLCGPTAIVTMHGGAMLEVAEVAAVLQEDLRLVQPNVAALLYQILDAVLHGMLPIYLELRSDLDAATERLELASGVISIDDVLALKRRATRLSHALEDHLFCIRELHAAESETLPLRTMRIQFQELLSTLERGQITVNRLEDRIRDLRQAHASLMQETTNRRLKVLAVLSSIYMPATLIAGIYGMNFNDIPIQQVSYGYVLVLLLMFALVAGHMLFFWKRRWFK